MNDLRKEFWEEIYNLAKEDGKIIVLIGDLGFSFVEKFQKELPNQIINCGIAEQNMIGVAAGLAIQGFHPFVYSNSIFLLGRAYEQIRDDVCYNDLNVKLIGTGASGFLGFSHNWQNGEEDNVLKSLSIKSCFPKNNQELKVALLDNKIKYIRI